MKHLFLAIAAAALVGTPTVALASEAKSENYQPESDFTRGALSVDDKLKVAHLYTGKDGKSYYEWHEISPQDLPFFDKPNGYRQYFGSKAKWVDLFAAPAGGATPDHMAGNQTEMVFVLAGTAYMELSGGQTVNMGPGTVMILEDNKLPGHWGSVGPKGYVAVHVTLDQPVNLPKSK